MNVGISSILELPIAGIHLSSGPGELLEDEQAIQRYTEGLLPLSDRFRGRYRVRLVVKIWRELRVVTSVTLGGNTPCCSQIIIYKGSNV